MKLNENSPIPLYYQLQNIVRNKIEKGEYKIGDKIPSERKLSEKVGLSRMTIRKAINNLVKEGILERRRGQGTFVSQNNNDSLPGLLGFKEHVEARDMVPSSKLIEHKVIKIGNEIAEKLNIEFGEEVILTVRLRLADSRPIGFEKSYIPYSICPRLLEVDLAKGSIYNCLKEVGYAPTGANQEIEAILCNNELSVILGIEEGKPILQNTRTTFSGEIPIEFSYNYYIGDRYSIITKASD